VSLAQLLLLTKRVPWYGAATGYYSMLPPALAATGTQVDVVTPRSGMAVRVLGKLWSWRKKLPARHQSLAFAEWEFLRRFQRAGTPGVILAIEDHLPLLSLPQFAGGAPRRLVGVIHFPRALWTEPMLGALARLRSALVLYRSEVEFFEQIVGRGRVKFVRHGVDLCHFSPGPERPIGPPRLLVSGQFGRDFELLAKVFPRVQARYPDCRLEIVGAHHARLEPVVRTLAAMPGVTLHEFCPDAVLLEHYRAATLMLLPLRLGGANNALVEALACGVPVIATDLGGVRDYGGGKVFPVVPPGSAVAMADEINALIADRSRRRATAMASRAFAEQHLSWTESAAEHREALRDLTGEENTA
jgi:glycosyltransferase involved in cell wall biosynthesis